MRIRPTRWEVIAGRFGYLDAPVWNGRSLLFAEFAVGRVFVCHPRERRWRTLHTRLRAPAGLALDARKRAIVAEWANLETCSGGNAERGAAVIRFDEGGERRVLASSSEHAIARPYAFALHPKGGFFFSDAAPSGGAIFFVDADDRVRRVSSTPMQPFGIALSADARTLFVASSPGGDDALLAFDVAPDATLHRPRVLHRFVGERGGGGVAVAVDGSVMIVAGEWTRGAGPRVVVVSPDGRVLRMHALDAPSSGCCFGGDDGKDFFVTGFDGLLRRARLGDACANDDVSTSSRASTPVAQPR